MLRRTSWSACPTAERIRTAQQRAIAKRQGALGSGYNVDRDGVRRSQGRPRAHRERHPGHGPRAGRASWPMSGSATNGSSASTASSPCSMTASRRSDCFRCSAGSSTSTTVAAVLTIAGFSVNDTVVIYDRIREELRRYKKMPLGELLNMSINRTLSRTIMTSGLALPVGARAAVFRRRGPARFQPSP